MSATPSSDPASVADATRRRAMQHWLEQQIPGAAFAVAPASADASFRRYFRIAFAAASTPSLIVMDAPPAQEDCRPFVRVATLFAAADVHVPKVLAQDLDQGFLLLSDLGSTTYLAALNDTSADRLYHDAIVALIRIQAASRANALPDYDRAALERELRLFPDWYVARQLERTLNDRERALLEAAFERLLANNLAQPRVFVHRDYHSRNLMVSDPNPGVLDFQDALYGPITYDLVSLLRDAYVEWEEERQIDWCIHYWERARKAGLPVSTDFGSFYRDFEWMGVQRQLKVIGIFARLCYRDGKRQYLDDQPRVIKYLRAACSRYNELRELARLLDEFNGQSEQRGYTF